MKRARRFALILGAGYEGLTGRSWQELMTTSPEAAAFIRVLFRVYGAYVAAFGLLATALAATAFGRGEHWSWWALLVGYTIAFVSAMTYDWTVGAIEPFELTEYLGLAMVWGALEVTAPFRALADAAPPDLRMSCFKGVGQWNLFTLPI